MRSQRLNVVVKVGIVLALGSGAVADSTAQAATFTVNNTSDAAGLCPTATTCSLRQALGDADIMAGSDVVDFDLPANSEIALTSGPLIILPNDPNDAVAITGPGNGLTVRHAPTSAPDPVFVISAGRGATLSGFTISGGLSGISEGAAIDAFSPLVLDRMTIMQNVADAEGGGSSAGLLVRSSATIRRTSIFGNSVINSGRGGSAGALVNVGDVLIVNSTLGGNQVTGTGSGDGGAILNLGKLTLLNTTVSGNNAPAGIGGVAGAGFGMANTILAGNTGTLPDCGTSVDSQGYNILGIATGCRIVAAAGDQIGGPGAPIDPLLGTLSFSGGETPTMALLAGSSARDAGNPATPRDAGTVLPPNLTPCAPTDQRGFARPGGPRCDIGAFEIIPQTLVLPPPARAVSPPAPPPFVAPPVDHFKCYRGIQRGFRKRSVRLRDQFATRTARLRTTTLVCNPARKDGSKRLAPRAHLVCYESRDVTPFRPRSVSVTNQFGTQVLRVVRPVSLCVPSLKRKGARAPGRSPDPERRLDHFRCYGVDPKLTPRSVRTSDEFVSTRTTVVSVARICNPVTRCCSSAAVPGKDRSQRAGTARMRGQSLLARMAMVIGR